MANSGPSFGLHHTCRLKAQEKFDLSAAKEALRWIESVSGHKLAGDSSTVSNEREVADLLKDGTALCEVMNQIQPGAIIKYHKDPKPFQQMENAELFLRACVDYGMEVIDTFQVKELYEARAMYTVINCIYSLGSLAQTRGYTGPKLGVRRAQRHERQFSEEQMQEARRTLSRQHSTPVDAPSQAKMTPYGLPRQITLSQTAAADVDPASHGVIGLQYGSNQVASRSGMTDYGTPRQIASPTSSLDPADIYHLRSDSSSTPASPTLTSPNGDSADVQGPAPTFNHLDHTQGVAARKAENEAGKKSRIPTLAKSKPEVISVPGCQQQAAAAGGGGSPGSPTGLDAGKVGTRSSLGSSSSRNLPTSPILKTDPTQVRPRQFSASAEPVISLQYGSNKVASQAGMTAYGMPRQIVAAPRASLASASGLADGLEDVFDGALR